MPNRILKESVCMSKDIDKLKPEEEVFFYRLIVNCDDFGRFEASLPILRSRCFPWKIDKLRDKDIQKWLEALANEKLIILYEVDDKPYLQMTTWEKHQQIRAKRSKYPGLDSENAKLISNDIKYNQLKSNVTVIQSNPIQSESNPIRNYAEFVKMEEAQYQKLVEEYGLTTIQDMIQRLNNYVGSSGKKYKSHYHTILTWIRKDKDKKGKSETIIKSSGTDLNSLYYNQTETNLSEEDNPFKSEVM